MSITFIVCCRKLNFFGEPANLNRYSTVNLEFYALLIIVIMCTDHEMQTTSMRAR